MLRCTHREFKKIYIFRNLRWMRKFTHLQNKINKTELTACVAINKLYVIGNRNLTSIYWTLTIKTNIRFIIVF